MRKFVSIIALLTLSTPALAGTCRHYANGGGSVTSCDNGSVTLNNGRHTQQYGHENAGFDRYPDEPDFYYRQYRR